MAGGITTVDLVSAVSNAGGIGSFGFAYSSAEKIATDLKQVKQLTAGPINANFFIFQEPSEPTKADCHAAISALEAVDIQPETGWHIPSPPYYPDLHEQIEPVWTYKPEILTFHFGLPPQDIFEKAKSLNIKIGITATSAEDVTKVTDAGADFIVLQGYEAGGHRGTFSADAADQKLNSLSLLTLAKSLTKLPLVSAGGIMEREDILACLSAGASAVQMGTAFLTVKEAGTNTVYRRYLLEEHHRKTGFTKAFSGRWARSLETDFTVKMAGQPVLPFPLQNTLTGPMRQDATRSGNGEYQSFWAGTGFQKCRDISVQELMHELVDESG